MIVLLVRANRYRPRLPLRLFSSVLLPELPELPLFEGGGLLLVAGGE